MTNKPEEKLSNDQIQLIVGLGNPGAEYTNTRHNVGYWFIEKLCEHFHITPTLENKFKGFHALISHSTSFRILLPITYMNRSGQAVGALANFYKIAPTNILVVHDELDLSVGTAKLKLDGGHGGHNGLRDIIAHLGTNRFYRLRIGIGHPGSKDLVHDYVLHKPSLNDKTKIFAAIDQSLSVLPDILGGKMQQAMNTLHTLAK